MPAGMNPELRAAGDPFALEDQGLAAADELGWVTVGQEETVDDRAGGLKQSFQSECRASALNENPELLTCRPPLADTLEPPNCKFHT